MTTSIRHIFQRHYVKMKSELERSFTMSTIENFEAFVRKMNAYEEASSVMYWDLRTGAPKKSVAGRSDVIGLLSTEAFKMSVSEEMEDYIKTLPKEKLSLPLKKTLEQVAEDFELQKKIPAA